VGSKRENGVTDGLAGRYPGRLKMLVSEIMSLRTVSELAERTRIEGLDLRRVGEERGSGNCDRSAMSDGLKLNASAVESNAVIQGRESNACG
jgi:hypothetical protein